MIKFVIIIVAIFMSSHTNAINITIQKGVENPIPIAIVPFAWLEVSAQPIKLEQVIANNLARSARFSVMDFNDLPQRPIRLKDVNFNDWRLLGMENLVIGQLQQTDDGKYEIKFWLIDVFKQKTKALKLSATEEQLRIAAHELSDIIYEKLIGVPGAFATKIAYVAVSKQSDAKKNYLLQIADADGQNPFTLLQSTQPIMSPSWSPDGQYLAYVSFESARSNIFVQNLQTGKRDKVAANKGINSAPAWSPDGSRLALTLSKDGNTEIYILHLASGELNRVTNNRAIDTEPSWSHDGNKLAFTSDRSGSPQIYQINTVGDGRLERLTFEGTYNARPRYSYDGHSIAMVTFQEGAYRIAILNLRNKHFNILTQAKLDESPSFSPNDHMIIYTTTDSKGVSLAAVSVDGQVHQRLTLHDVEVREPVWGPFLPR